MIALVHPQRVRIGSKGGLVGVRRPRRTCRNTVRLNPGKVDRFGAVRVQVPGARHFEAVDVECRTPMRHIAAYLRNERRKPRGVELKFEERRAREEWRISIAVGNARPVGKGIRVANSEGEPEGYLVLERLGCGQGPLARQRDIPLQVVAGVGNGRDESDARLIVTDVMAIVVATLTTIGVEKVSARQTALERRLDGTVAIAIEIAHRCEVLST